MRIPLDTVISSGRENFEQTTKNLQKKLKDYHVLVMADNKIKTAEFECFNVADLDTKTVQELREVITNTLTPVEQ